MQMNFVRICTFVQYAIVLYFGHFLSSIGQLILHSNMHTKSLAATQLEKQLTKRGQALYKCEWIQNEVKLNAWIV